MRKIRVFDYLWHIPHQFDMMNALKDDCDFFFGLNIKTQWDKGKRPVPENLKFVSCYEPDMYDIAILHIDQMAVCPSDRKRTIFNEFNDQISDIPKIIINHGSPMLTEWFNRNALDYSEDEIKEICRAEVKKLVGENTMVVNSHTAASAKEWGFGHAIVHGLDQSQWINGTKEPRVFTAMSTGGFDHYYNRKMLNMVSDILSNKYGYTLNHAKVNVDTGKDPNIYKSFLGSSLIYLDTSFRTPMNRARTEAFLSGCCVVQVEGAHDLERWAVHGENIIIVPNDASVISRVIVDLIENRYQEAVDIGAKGRAMAIREFSPSRYRQNWLDLFAETLKETRIFHKQLIDI